jgi:hypothetical protein
VGFSRLAQLYVYECKGKFSSQYSAIFIESFFPIFPLAKASILRRILLRK